MEYSIYPDETDNIFGKRAKKRRKAKKKMRKQLRRDFGSIRKGKKALKSKYGVRRVGLITKARAQALKKGMNPDDPEAVKSQIRGIRKKRRKIGKIAGIAGATVGAAALALKGKPTQSGKLLRRMKAKRALEVGKKKPVRRFIGGLFKGKKRLGGPGRRKPLLGGLFKGRKKRLGGPPKRGFGLIKSKKEKLLKTKPGRGRLKKLFRRKDKSKLPKTRKRGILGFGKKRGKLSRRKPVTRGLGVMVKKKISDPFSKLIPLKRTMVKGLRAEGVSASTKEPVGQVANKFYNKIVVPSRSNFWNAMDINHQDNIDDSLKQSIVKGILEYIAIARMNAEKGEASPIEEKVAKGAEEVEERIEEKVKEEAAQEAGQKILFDTKTQLMILGIVVLLVLLLRKV